MKSYKIIAFDLDGTISDPASGLIGGYKYAFSKMGIQCEEDEKLKRFIGPPLYDEWQRCYGLSPEEAARAIHYFREYYTIYGWWDNVIYPGVKELLSHLKSCGKTIVLSTSKPEYFARKILDLFGISEYFDFVGAATPDHRREKKWEVLAYALEGVGASDLSECIIVGDRKYDAEGAAICGIDSLGVLYGHGSREELTEAGFTYICENCDEVAALLLR